MRGTAAGPRSMLIGGGKLGRAGRASGRSEDSILTTGDRMAGKPPAGTWGLVLELVAHGSGAARGA